MVAVSDGALGFWAELCDVFPATREQRCWVHKTANVLAALPKRLHKPAKAALTVIYAAECRADALTAAESFADDFADHPKAVRKISNDLEVLLTFYDFPAEPWIHLRTTNPIESTFSTVRLRIRVTRGAGSRNAALAMPTSCSTQHNTAGDASTLPNSSPSSEAGATFIDGRLQVRKEATNDTTTESVAA